MAFFNPGDVAYGPDNPVPTQDYTDPNNIWNQTVHYGGPNAPQPTSPAPGPGYGWNTSTGSYQAMDPNASAQQSDPTNTDSSTPTPGASTPQVGNGQWTGTFVPPTQAEVAATPGYQFGISEVQRLGQNSAAAQGNILNPRTTQALQQAETSFADTNYQQAYNNAFANYQNQEGQFNQNFSNAQTGALNAAQIQNALGYFNLFGQNQGYNQGQETQQNQFQDWLNYQQLIRPPNPSAGS